MVLEYRKAKDKAAFRREHESQLILYEAAAKAIKDAGITRLPDLAALKAEYRELDKQKGAAVRTVRRSQARAERIRHYQAEWWTAFCG